MIVGETAAKSVDLTGVEPHDVTTPAGVDGDGSNHRLLHRVVAAWAWRRTAPSRHHHPEHLLGHDRIGDHPEGGEVHEVSVT